jgi:hypothetical protein
LWQPNPFSLSILGKTCPPPPPPPPPHFTPTPSHPTLPHPASHPHPMVVWGAHPNPMSVYFPGPLQTPTILVLLCKTAFNLGPNVHPAA